MLGQLIVSLHTVVITTSIHPMSDYLDAKTAGCYHVPVLLEESVEALVTDPSGIYIDATLGGGGHSRHILEHLSEGGHLFGVDRDADAEANNSIRDPRFTFVRSDFRYIHRFMDYFGVEAVDGILADLGVSSHHLDAEERGFSFRFDAPIDMRMNRSGGRSAADILRDYSLDDLSRVLREYGEVKGAYRIAQAIVDARDDHDIKSVGEFLDAIAKVCPPHDKKNLARIFQALRIEVNDEMGALESLLVEGSGLLKPGGRMVIITYHSLEDRPVKNFFRHGNLSGERLTDVYGMPLSHMEPLTTKPLIPSDMEQEVNPRSRSAKLRVGVRKE